MAELNISERQVDDVGILDMEGDITFGEGSTKFRQAIRKLLSEGKKKIILNFSGVRYVDSSGIGELVSAMMAASRKQAQLKSINAHQRLRELLVITKLATLVEVFATEEEALKGFE